MKPSPIISFKENAQGESMHSSHTKPALTGHTYLKSDESPIHLQPLTGVQGVTVADQPRTDKQRPESPPSYREVFRAAAQIEELAELRLGLIKPQPTPVESYTNSYLGIDFVLKTQQSLMKKAKSSSQQKLIPNNSALKRFDELQKQTLDRAKKEEEDQALKEIYANDPQTSKIARKMARKLIKERRVQAALSQGKLVLNRRLIRGDPAKQKRGLPGLPSEYQSKENELWQSSKTLSVFHSKPTPFMQTTSTEPALQTFYGDKEEQEEKTRYPSTKHQSPTEKGRAAGKEGALNPPSLKPLKPTKTLGNIHDSIPRDAKDESPFGLGKSGIAYGDEQNQSRAARLESSLAASNKSQLSAESKLQNIYHNHQKSSAALSQSHSLNKTPVPIRAHKQLERPFRKPAGALTNQKVQIYMNNIVNSAGEAKDGEGTSKITEASHDERVNIPSVNFSEKVARYQTLEQENIKDLTAEEVETLFNFYNAQYIKMFSVNQPINYKEFDIMQQTVAQQQERIRETEAPEGIYHQPPVVHKSYKEKILLSKYGANGPEQSPQVGSRVIQEKVQQPYEPKISHHRVKSTKMSGAVSSRLNGSNTMQAQSRKETLRKNAHQTMSTSMDSIALALNPQVASLNIIPHHYQSQAAFGVSRMIGNGNNGPNAGMNVKLFLKQRQKLKELEQQRVTNSKSAHMESAHHSLGSVERGDTQQNQSIWTLQMQQAQLNNDKQVPKDTNFQETIINSKMLSKQLLARQNLLRKRQLLIDKNSGLSLQQIQKLQCEIPSPAPRAGRTGKGGLVKESAFGVTYAVMANPSKRSIGCTPDLGSDECQSLGVKTDSRAHSSAMGPRPNNRVNTHYISHQTSFAGQRLQSSQNTKRPAKLAQSPQKSMTNLASKLVTPYQNRKSVEPRGDEKRILYNYTSTCKTQHKKLQIGDVTAQAVESPTPGSRPSNKADSVQSSSRRPIYSQGKQKLVDLNSSFATNQVQQRHDKYLGDTELYTQGLPTFDSYGKKKKPSRALQDTEETRQKLVTDQSCNMFNENLEGPKAPPIALAEMQAKAEPNQRRGHTPQLAPGDAMLACSSNNDLSSLLTPEERAGHRNKKRVGRIDTKPLTNHQRMELTQRPQSVLEGQEYADGEGVEKQVTEGATARHQKLSVSQSSHSHLHGHMNKRFEASHSKIGELAYPQIQVDRSLVLEKHTTTLARAGKHVDQYEKLKDELGDTHHIKVFVGKEDDDGRMSSAASPKEFEMNRKREDTEDPWKVEDTYHGDSVDVREDAARAKPQRSAKESKVQAEIRKFKERNELGRQYGFGNGAGCLGALKGYRNPREGPSTHASLSQKGHEQSQNQPPLIASDYRQREAPPGELAKWECARLLLHPQHSSAGRQSHHVPESSASQQSHSENNLSPQGRHYGLDPTERRDDVLLQINTTAAMHRSHPYATSFQHQDTDPPSAPGKTARKSLPSGRPCYKLCPVNDLYQIALQVEHDGPASSQKTMHDQAASKYNTAHQSIDIVGEATEQLRQSHAEKKPNDKNRPLKSRLGRAQHATVDTSLFRALEVNNSRESSPRKAAGLDGGAHGGPDLQQYKKARIDRYEMELGSHDSAAGMHQGPFDGTIEHRWESPGMPYTDQDIYARSTTLNEPTMNFEQKPNLKTMVSLRNIDTKTGSSSQPRKERLHTQDEAMADQGAATRENTLKMAHQNRAGSQSNSGGTALAESQLPQLGNVTVVRPSDLRGSSVSSAGEEQHDSFDARGVVAAPMDPTMIFERKRQSDLTLRLQSQSGQGDLKSLPPMSGQRSNVFINGAGDNARAGGSQNPFGDVVTTQTNVEYAGRDSVEAFSSARHSQTVSQSQGSEYVQHQLLGQSYKAPDLPRMMNFDPIPQKTYQINKMFQQHPQNIDIKQIIAKRNAGSSQRSKRGGMRPQHNSKSPNPDDATLQQQQRHESKSPMKNLADQGKDFLSRDQRKDKQGMGVNHFVSRMKQPKKSAYDEENQNKNTTGPRRRSADPEPIPGVSGTRIRSRVAECMIQKVNKCV